MINNYYHDFATAIIIVSTYFMLRVLNYAEKDGSVSFKKRVMVLYPKMLHITGGVLILAFMAGIVRTFVYSWFEWIWVLGKSQVIVFILKHVFMFTIIGYGIYLWIGMRGRVKRLKGVGLR
ncbi:MAG: hypothetical protein WA162_05995 [Thermodesulfobacteriota bacterium]